jgi:multiple antibiotic resistance protein
MPLIEGLDVAKTLTALLAITNPIGNAPLFLSMTADNAPAERRRIALVATLAVFVTLTVIAVAGEAILTTFGVTIDDLRIAGRLVVLLIGLSMLHAQPTGIHGSSAETREGAEKASPAVVPLAIPIVAGPGAMATVLVTAHGAASAMATATLIGVIAATAAVLYLCFRIAVPTQRVLGISGMNIVVRIMGLLLAVIAVDMIAHGLRGEFPILATPLA